MNKSFCIKEGCFYVLIKQSNAQLQRNGIEWFKTMLKVYFALKYCIKTSNSCNSLPAFYQGFAYTSPAGLNSFLAFWRAKLV